MEVNVKFDIWVIITDGAHMCKQGAVLPPAMKMSLTLEAGCSKERWK